MPLSLATIRNTSKRFYQSSGNDLVTDIDTNFSALNNGILQKTNVTVSTSTGADYLCNGVTDDVQIQAAINYVASLGGGTIDFKGSFNITASIILKSNVSLKGYGYNTIFTLASGVNGAVFTTNPGTMSTKVSNVEISNISIDGNKLNNTSSSGIRIVWGENFYIHHCNTINTNAQGIETVSYDDPPNTKISQYIWVENNYISNPGRNCIYIGYKTTNFFVKNNYCYGGGSVAEGYGVMAGDYSVSYGVVEGNICINNGLYGIGHTSNNVEVIGNIIKGSGDTGIRINAATDAFGTESVNGGTVIGNTVQDAGGNGISIEGNCRNMSVTGNTIDNPSTHGMAVAIYSGFNPENISIANNIITNGHNKGITITSSGTGVTVTGNTVKNMANQGIHLYSNDVIANNNSVSNCGTSLSYNYGIWIQGNNNIVTGNRVTDTQSTKTQAYGIRNEVGSTKNIIANNQLAGNLTVGLSDVGTSTANNNNITS